MLQVRPSPEHPEVARTRVSPYPLRDRTPPPEEARMRVSPYPLRVRTAPQGLVTPLRARSRTPTSGGPRPPAPRKVTPSPLEPDQFQLIIKPNNSVGQRETSGDTLCNFLVDGSTFQDILGKLWEKFSHRIKGEPSSRMSEKTERAWNLWMVSRCGKTIQLMIYEYGVAITKARDLDAFLAPYHQEPRPIYLERCNYGFSAGVYHTAAETGRLTGQAAVVKLD
ncbi:hypothetical protein PI126_g10450 [Phytophthora idaei]|nr:hypothetical protein PI126_g10450 [Phytophthora idaei]